MKTGRKVLHAKAFENVSNPLEEVGIAHKTTNIYIGLAVWWRKYESDRKDQDSLYTLYQHGREAI